MGHQALGALEHLRQTRDRFVIDPTRSPKSYGGKFGALRFARGALFRKYVVLFASVMGTGLIASSLADIWFIWRDHRAALVRIQQEQAGAAAAQISQFITEIEGQLGWMTHLSWSKPLPEQRELDTLRLLRQVPAIMELSLLDAQGRERLHVSRQAMDVTESNADYSGEERFKMAIENRVYYGPVYFRRETEPYMTLAVAGPRRETGVSVAQVNLKLIWDVVNEIRVGRSGRAYVVDAEGRLIAHPDISLVLRNTDMSQYAQVRTARAASSRKGSASNDAAFDVHGERVLTAYATAEPLNWLVFVELPELEANEQLNAAIARSAILVLAGLFLAFLAALILARRMVVPIETLTQGASLIGAGELDHRIMIRTGDELETLGAQFNHMTNQLQASYASLERKVEDRTHQLQAANLSKSRFLAVASHDLRQPLHALNLLVAQLRFDADESERALTTQRINAAVGGMNELFNALLDISQLDAGALEPRISEFAIHGLLARIEATFAPAAREKGLHFSMVACSAWVRSDAILLERILLNLVSNAVRYTTTGGVLVGCRRQRGYLRLDVYDSGIGIPQDQQRAIFAEFYRGRHAEQARTEGLGLGLAIVERLCDLLNHPLDLTSEPGSGSRFCVTVPMVEAGASAASPLPLPDNAERLDLLRDRLVVLLDDDPMVLDATGSLLSGWGCIVVTARAVQEALLILDGKVPDLIISDYHLGQDHSGIDSIAHLRQVYQSEIPAFLISGDIALERLREAKASGHHLLHKPVNPMVLRAMMHTLLKNEALV